MGNECSFTLNPVTSATSLYSLNFSINSAKRTTTRGYLLKASTTRDQIVGTRKCYLCSMNRNRVCKRTQLRIVDRASESPPEVKRCSGSHCIKIAFSGAFFFPLRSNITMRIIPISWPEVIPDTDPNFYKNSYGLKKTGIDERKFFTTRRVSSSFSNSSFECFFNARKYSSFA